MSRGDKRGVALLVTNPKREIIILEEFQEKREFGKLAGMFSIPMETSEPAEDDCLTLKRLVEHELCGFNSKIYIERLSGSYQVVPGIWVFLYVAQFPDCVLPSLDPTGEVGNHRWMNPRMALDLRLRQGAREMIRDYLNGYGYSGKIVRFKCKEVI
ncbi:MAG: NUDIX hydrolase [Patescibacteria group bacterium]